MTWRRVVVRDPEETEMVTEDRDVKAFAKQLIRDRKGFEATPNEDGTWTFVVYEINHPTRWEAQWRSGSYSRNSARSRRAWKE